MLERWRYHQQQLIKHGYMSPCACHGEAYRPADVEHVANVLTHMVSIIPACYAMSLMLVESTSSSHQLCGVVYGLALIMLFTVSTIFHIISYFDKSRESRMFKLFHLSDRYMIYIFISASYMPWLLLQNFGMFGINLVTLVWGSAIAGIIYSTMFHEKHKMFQTALYLCQGFLPCFAMLSRSSKGVNEIVLGGLLYVTGVVFFKSDGKLPGAHAMWHIFGSTAAWVHHYGIWIHFYA